MSGKELKVANVLHTYILTTPTIQFTLLLLGQRASRRFAAASDYKNYRLKVGKSL